MVHLLLTPEEADLVRTALHWWTNDYDDATNDVINDRTLETPEAMLEAVAGMHEIYATTQSILEKLNVSGAASSL